jgi:hypothetical protein
MEYFTVRSLCRLFIEALIVTVRWLHFCSLFAKTVQNELALVTFVPFSELLN